MLLIAFLLLTDDFLDMLYIPEVFLLPLPVVTKRFVGLEVEFEMEYTGI